MRQVQGRNASKSFCEKVHDAESVYTLTLTQRVTAQEHMHNKNTKHQRMYSQKSIQRKHASLRVMHAKWVTTQARLFNFFLF